MIKLSFTIVSIRKMATYLCHKWRGRFGSERRFGSLVSAPTIGHRTPMTYSETDLYESLRIRFGKHINVSLKHEYNQFYLRIESSVKPQKIEKIKPIYDFMKRWGQDIYMIRLLDLDVDTETIPTDIPIPICYSIKDPSNY